MINKELYQQALKNLEQQHASTLQEVANMEREMTTLREMLGEAGSSTVVVPARPNVPKNAFLNISVRWAILKLFAEHAPRPLKTAEISEALTEGGNENASKTNVSAVISDMVKKRSELEPVDDGYNITELGKVVWKAVKHSARYENRNAISSDS